MPFARDLCRKIFCQPCAMCCCSGPDGDNTFRINLDDDFDYEACVNVDPYDEPSVPDARAAVAALDLTGNDSDPEVLSIRRRWTSPPDFLSDSVLAAISASDSPRQRSTSRRSVSARSGNDCVMMPSEPSTSGATAAADDDVSITRVDHAQTSVSDEEIARRLQVLASVRS